MKFRASHSSIFTPVARLILGKFLHNRIHMTALAS